MRKEQSLRDLTLKKDVAMIPGYALVIIWSVFTILVLLWVFSASLSSTKEIFSGAVFKFESGFNFKNYSKAWGSGKFSVYFGNSVFYVIVSGILTILISAPAAYVLSRFRFKMNSFLQKIFVAGMSIPAIMIIMPLFSLAIRYSLTNSRTMLTFMYTCVNVPFSVFFLMAFFRTLPTDYEEAAIIDGCSQPGAFWRIMLPLARPGVITLALFNLLGTWNDYFMALIFANNTKIKPVGLGLFNIIQSMRYTSDYASLFAAVAIGVLPTMIVFIFLSDKIMSSTTSGGIKQ